MKQLPVIRIKLLFIASFVLLTLTATAQQFKKPLTSPRDRVESNDAKWNVGILGGGNLTTWLHFHSRESSSWFLKNYNVFDTITNSLGYFGGIGVERMLKSNLSVGLNVVYAKHSIQLGANYHAIEAYVPITYYIGLSSKNIVPYVFAAPRVSYLLPDTTAKMTYTNSYYKNDANNTHISTSSNTVPFNRSTYRLFNVGATIGFGSLFRINTSNYYFGQTASMVYGSKANRLANGRV